MSMDRNGVEGDDTALSSHQLAGWVDQLTGVDNNAADTERLLQEPRARPFEMRGREMNGWLHIDVDASVPDDELARWIRIGVTYARSLPPK